jgi:HK97 family phage major capsid protein
MDPKKMREKRNELTVKAREIMTLAETENREMTTTEGMAFEDYMSQVDELSTKITRAERLYNAETETGLPTQPPTRIDVGTPAEQRAATNGEPKRFASFGEQMQAVMRAAIDPRNTDMRLSTRAVSGMSEGVPSDGGFLVQTDFSTELLKRAYETGQCASRCRRVGVKATANGLKINAVDEISRADGSRWGGVRAYWTAEAGDKTLSAPHFRQVELSLKKLTGLAYATDELLDDSQALEDILMTAFSEEFGFRLDDAIINGDGVGKPLGILASPSLVSITKEAGQVADSLYPENIIKMWSRCYSRSRLNSVWFINQDIEPQLFTLAIAVGTGGGTVYMPPGGLSAQPYGTLFGRPVIPIEQCQTLGDKGDIILTDLSQYILIDKGGIQSASSIHVRFVNDESVFRFVYRVDGQPIWHSALTPFTGSANTVSPFVTLDARA